MKVLGSVEFKKKICWITFLSNTAAQTILIDQLLRIEYQQVHSRK